MQRLFALLALFVGIYVEATVTTLPLVLLVLIFLYSKKQEGYVFFFAFLSGILLDIATVQRIGGSSIYFLLCLFIIMLYEKKFEVETGAFVFFATLFSSIGFLLIFQHEHIILQAILTSMIGVGLFTLSNFFSRQSVNEKHDIGKL